jgi:hypothetical protein
VPETDFVQRTPCCQTTTREFDLATARATRYAETMFPTVATVKHVQKDVENNRFHAKAEVTLNQDVAQTELQLKDVDESVHATAIMNAKAGVYFFFIDGEGEPPFKVGDTIRVNCFGKGEMPKNDFDAYSLKERRALGESSGDTVGAEGLSRDWILNSPAQWMGAGLISLVIRERNRSPAKIV